MANAKHNYDPAQFEIKKYLEINLEFATVEQEVPNRKLLNAFCANQSNVA